MRPQLDQSSDIEVLNAITSGQVERFEVLMRRHNQMVYRTVRSILSEADAEEAMQRTYLTAYAKLDTFEGRARFSTWLVRIALNTAMQILREQQRHEAKASAEVVYLRNPNPETEAARTELRGVLERSIDQLTMKNRTVFILSEIEGMSGPQIAEALQVSEETVRARLSRARTQLRAEIQRLMGNVTREAFSFYRPRCDRVVGAVLDRLRIV